MVCVSFFKLDEERQLKIKDYRLGKRGTQERSEGNVDFICMHLVRHIYKSHVLIP